MKILAEGEDEDFDYLKFSYEKECSYFKSVFPKVMSTVPTTRLYSANNE